MYWPIGAPRAYAISKLGLEKRSPIQSAHNDENGEHDILPQHGTDDVEIGGEILAVKSNRNGHLFVTITASSLSVWQTKPTSVVATVIRSASSVQSYGHNVNLLVRPDAAIVVVQTTLGYLITYSLKTNPESRLYQSIVPEEFKNLSRKGASFAGHGEGHGIRQVSIRFRMAIKVDAGIAYALALDNELVITTEKPPALQCVLWVPDASGVQATTTLLKTMLWISRKSHVTSMADDKPMNISTWITSDGKCYAVQKQKQREIVIATTMIHSKGHCVHDPKSEEQYATMSAINAKFSMIAVGCANSQVFVYTQKDYAGRIPYSHKLDLMISPSTCGPITCISFSPDGYCVIVGYRHGWAIWSVYGKPSAQSFKRFLNDDGQDDDEQWLRGVKDAFWIGDGLQIVILGFEDNRLWVLDMTRSAVTGCFSSANIARSLLQTNTGFMIYRGYELPDLGTISNEIGLWNHVQIPAEYLNRQWPIRSAVISVDGRYVAVAGRRGLAHYNVITERWKQFEDSHVEDDFIVKGGMCWHQHGLIVAVESSDGFQIRVYFREWQLDNHTMFTQNFSSPIVHLASSGSDAILVYTMENHLHHFLVNIVGGMIRLEQVGQIALSGILKQPSRVRALSWMLPDDQLEYGDPHQDVGHATVLFLIDGQLVVLLLSTRESGELKYDMRPIASNVEYYILMRDQLNFNSLGQQITDESREDIPGILPFHQTDLNDSLWFFNGSDVLLWTNIQEVLAWIRSGIERELPKLVNIHPDFYPLSILLGKGIVFGIEPEFIQKQKNSFSVLKFNTGTILFIPQILNHHLDQCNQRTALYLAHLYSHLIYFDHALEVLLRDVLEKEVDARPALVSESKLPSVITLISNFPQYLDVIVNCARKTETQSWHTLFKHLPPPRRLFEDSLSAGKLKTAGRYLLVLHTLEGLDVRDDGAVELVLGRAKEAGEWKLCMELARFLMALDDSGEILTSALGKVGLLVKANVMMELKQQGKVL